VRFFQVLLFLSAWFSLEVKHYAVFQVLLEAMMQRVKAEQERNDLLTICLVIACGDANEAVVRLLLATGANANNKPGGTFGAGLNRVTPLQMLTAAKVTRALLPFPSLTTLVKRTTPMRMP
jgi:hypothetical protein